jgi:uncharacterized integral membrane protein
VSDDADNESVPPVANPEGAETPIARGQAEAPSKVLSTRTSRTWVAVLPALIVLVVILVFVIQNPKDVKVSLFSFSGMLPLSVALLGAMVLGALLVLALGSVRIVQLRMQVHRKAGNSKSTRDDT